MVDPAYDNLPYWLLLPNKKPAEAAHCRVDDAELVGSWYEGLVSAMRIEIDNAPCFSQILLISSILPGKP